MHHATPKALIACLLALPFAACGDEDGGGEEAAGPGDFCDQTNQMTSTPGAGPVLEGMQINGEWLAEFEAIEPATEIADEWALLIRDYKAYDEAVAEVDFDALEQQMEDAMKQQTEDGEPTTDSLPEDFADIQSQANEAMTIIQTEEHVNASNTVSQYLTDECS